MKKKVGEVLKIVSLIGVFICFMIFVGSMFFISKDELMMTWTFVGFIGFAFFGFLSVFGNILSHKGESDTSSNNGVDSESLSKMKEMGESLKNKGMKKCPYCGATNKEDATQCSSCGAKLD